MPAGDYGWISVSDNGPGVTPEHAARVFEPYFTTRPSGQGLGLSTAFGLVKQSRGFCCWTTAKWAVPAFPSLFRRPSASPNMRPPLAPRCRPRISCWPKTKPCRLSTTRALESVGFRVLPAESGEKALGIFDATPGISALVSDIRMGGISGIELVETLRRRDPDLPNLLISGYADEAARHSVSGLEIAFLAKPFGLKDLTIRIDAIL